MNWLNSQRWLRPALGVLVAVAGAFLNAQAQMGVNHPTVAGSAAGWILTVAGALGAASAGQSNSGLPPGSGPKP